MLRDLLTDKPQTKRVLAVRQYGCTCPAKKGSNCTHIRDVEDEVRNLIMRGELVYGSSAGYAIASGPNDPALDRYEIWLEGKRDSLSERLRAIRTAREARRSPVEQVSLWEAA